MTKESYIDEIKFRLSGGIIELELDDTAIGKVIDSCFREIQRYIDTVKLVTVDFSKCIDLSDYNVSTVTRIYRAESLTDGNISGSSLVDPMYLSMWQALPGTGNMYNVQDYMYNYMSYNTLMQLRNTTSTDLAFRFDKLSNKLYINISASNPKTITIEFIPKFSDVSEITSDYWVDILLRMSVAVAKITLGRIRSRYTQTNSLWTQDGEKMLEEGTNELNDLRDKLLTNSQLVYPID